MKRSLSRPMRAFAIAAAVFVAGAAAMLLFGIAPPPSAKPVVGAALAAPIALGGLAVLARVMRRARPSVWLAAGAIFFAAFAACAIFYRGAMVRLVYPCNAESDARCVGGTRMTPYAIKFCAANDCTSKLELLLNVAGKTTEVWVEDSISTAKQLLSGLFGLLMLLASSTAYSFLRGLSPPPVAQLSDDELRLALVFARRNYVRELAPLFVTRNKLVGGLVTAVTRAGSDAAALADPVNADVLLAWRTVEVRIEIWKILVRFLDAQMLALQAGVVRERAALVHLANDTEAVTEAVAPAATRLIEHNDAGGLRALFASCGIPSADAHLERLRAVKQPMLTAAAGPAEADSEADVEAAVAEPEPAPDPLLAEIFALRNNRHELEQLRAQVAGPGVIPFIGAGVSIPLGYPGWTAFLLGQAREAGLLVEIEADLKKGEYEAAAQRLEDAFTPFAFARRVEAVFAPRHAVSGAATILPRLARGAVLTTNFDPVLETAFADAGQPFESSVWGARVGPIAAALFQGRRHLIKLHGDANDEADRVLTAREYDHHYQAGGALPIVLTKFFSSTTILFIGCSLAYDRTMQKLAEAAAQEGPLPAHFALVESPATVEELRDRERELARRRIVPIWYPHGRHQSVELLLKFLAAR